ncbi:putative homeobox protein aristaless-like [Apostichopus japonicus]|uniref:Putative homeobox protein aristaless-like n=1 Tax=Stichopus japonicus TaxID=307972 RepID=A0A2G8LRE0_STIJA|nr:putative homeobox protein aristaless-like [Apostichopus japonicus]
MPASCVTLSSSPGTFRPICSAGLKPSDLSPTSSLSSIDERSNAEANLSTYNQQSPRQCSSQLPAVEPAVGLTPSSAMFPSGGLSPYKPPHPTPQDSLNASVRPIETCPPRNRRRRSRTIYNGMQINGLEACFKVNRYPDIETRENLAMYIGMSEARVQVWFQNRRARMRRQERNTVSTGEEHVSPGANDATNADRSRDDECQSDDVTGSDDVSSASNDESMSREKVTSEMGGDEHEEIDVVGISEERVMIDYIWKDFKIHYLYRWILQYSCKRSSSSLVKPIVTSTPSVASLVGKPLVSMPPPQVCTKPCCCPPLVLPQYPFLQHRIPSSSIQVPYHPGFYTSQTAGVPPVSLWNAPPLFYSFRPSLALQVPRSSRHGAPMPFR